MPDFWKLIVPTVVTLVVGAIVYTFSNENLNLSAIALVKSTTKESKETMNPSEEKRIKIVYATQSGSSKRLALILASLLPSKSQIMSIKEYETEDLFHEECVVIFILSTYTGGLGSADAEWFNNWLEDSRQDVRVGAEALSGLKYAVFGVGDSAYKDEFCQFGVKIDRLLFELGAKRLVKIGLGDLANDFRELNDFASRLSLNLTKSVDQVEKAALILSEDDDATENEEYEQDVLDIEDMGPSMIPKKEVEVKEMVTPNLRKSLQKQRYHIVGTHSGVKICRWTKSMLRGRGGCYKHSFYGIASHQCMESTPSLACANKCVFCW